jgi:rhodanese-related sulfurtransferase
MTFASPSTSPSAIRAALLARQEIAFFDVRDEATYAVAHPLFAASLPLSRIETELADRVPRRATPIVVYDDGEGLVEPAVERIRSLCYCTVSVLEGGLAGWRASGAELFRDVNVPSKAFGELVEAWRRTPSIAAEDLKARLDSGADLVVLDARRYEEYHTMSIPTAVSVPGAELVYRVGELAPRPETMVVVNCAGRTRSIIGAQSLVNAGIPNRVAALRNGTIGWTLAGFDLERGQTRRAPEVSHPRLDRARAAARRVAATVGVSRIDSGHLAAWVADPTRTTYRFDVRTPEEFAAGHLPGFRSAPGGQLVQETDVFAPVRGARIVLADDKGVRADMTASWLSQMGWEVHVLDGELQGDLEAGPWRPARPVQAVPCASQGTQAPAAYTRPYEGTDNPTAAMQAYLDWEYGLVAQLERDGTHGFRPVFVL